MRKWANRSYGKLLICLVLVCSASPADSSIPSIDQVTSSAISRAEAEILKIRSLVAEAVLPHKRLEEAEMMLADAQDNAILSKSLYSSLKIDELKPEETEEMVRTAQRRVERQNQLIAGRQKLVDEGVLAQNELSSQKEELTMRKHTLELATKRAELLNELIEMARAEQALESLNANRYAKEHSLMVRYDGAGTFTPANLKAVSMAYAKKFNQELPISAMGQTQVHQLLGFDHRGRVDVGINPDQPEGVWLRQYLEKARIPYFAFRSAIAGKATAPHIHIGPGSTRLKLAERISHSSQ